MALFNCENRHSCTGVVSVISIVAGITAIILQSTGVIAVVDLNVVALLFTALFFLATVLLVSAISNMYYMRDSALNACLVGITGTILSSAVVLLRGATFSTTVYPILVGAIMTFSTLMLLSVICLIKQLVNVNK